VWSHIVATYDGSNLKLYLNNGTPDSQATTLVPTSSSYTLYFGYPFDAGPAGIIDEIGMWNVVEIDKDGWMLCNPKPDNSVNCVEITKQMITSENEYILGKYGEQHEDGLRQFCKEGDFICQDRIDTTDTWIVARKIFLNTYSIKS
jgi:hypothetical protein